MVEFLMYCSLSNLRCMLHYDQRHTNSPVPAFPKEMETARPNNLPLKQQNETVGETICGITLSDIRNKLDQTDTWLRPSKKCALCPYTECRLCADGCICNILIASKAEEHENKDELLELFPLHPDGNLRSLTYRVGQQ